MFTLGILLIVIGLIFLFVPRVQPYAVPLIVVGVVLCVLDVLLQLGTGYSTIPPLLGAVAAPRRMLLSNVSVKALSLVEKGANRNQFFLFKSGDDDPGDVILAQSNEIVKASGEEGEPWSAAYVVVAAPDQEEDPGLFGDQDTVDVWASPDEIRKAAHDFMRNGHLVNKMHEDLEPHGQLVENAVALTDLTIETPDGPRTIAKGSWYVGIDPTPEGREAIDKGHFTGVSVQGKGTRVPADGDLVIKTDVDDAQDFIEQRDWIAKDAILVPDKPGPRNWIDRTGTGDLPKFIGDIAGDLITEKGKSTGEAIQLAVGIVRNWCHGQGNVTAQTRAKACAAAAEWEAKKAQSHVSKEQAGVLAKIGRWLTGGDCPDCEQDPVAKRKFSADKRRELASKGHAMSDGSFPIENCGDVSNAVKLAKTDAQRRHTAKRAKALGCTDALPDSWGALAKQAGTVGDVDEAQVKTLIEEATGPLGERIEKIETATESLPKLSEQLEDLSKRLPETDEKEQPATKDDLQRAIDQAADEAIAKIKPLQEQIDQLASGDSTQDGNVQKSAGEPSYESQLLA